MVSGNYFVVVYVHIIDFQLVYRRFIKKKPVIQTEQKGLNVQTGRRQPAGYLTAWPNT